MKKTHNSPFRLFSASGTPNTKNLRWQVTGASSFRITFSNFTSTNFFGQSDIPGPISGNGNYRGYFSGPGTIKIWIDNILQIDESNEYTVREQIGNSACVTYSIPTARDTCKSGYRKSTQLWYRIETRKRDSIRPGYRVDSFSPWYQYTTFPISANGFSFTRSGQTFTWYGSGNNHTRYTSYQIFTKEIVYCTPEANCQGDPIFGDVTKYKTQESGIFNLAIPESESQRQARLADEQAARDQEQSRIDHQNQIIQDNQNQVDYVENQAIPEIQPGSGQPGRYRVIDPPSVEILDGNSIPKLRFMTVRSLNPGDVSSFVIRGFEVQAVDSSTPVAFRSVYPPSVIERANAIARSTEKPAEKELPTVSRRKSVETAQKEIIRFRLHHKRVIR